MSKGIFIAGTGTDVGKTYISAMFVKTMRDAGYHCGYYKAAVSGAGSIAESDAGYVNRTAAIGQDEKSLLSYLYKTPVSPHLAAQIEGNPLCMHKVEEDYKNVCAEYDFVVAEGSGGIVCPIRWDDEAHILLENIVKKLSLPVLVVADAGLGTINATVLTVHYLKEKQIPVIGIIVNHYEEKKMQDDNMKMIEALTGISVVAAVKHGDTDLHIPDNKLKQLFYMEDQQCN